MLVAAPIIHHATEIGLSSMGAQPDSSSPLPIHSSPYCEQWEQRKDDMHALFIASGAGISFNR